MSPEMRHDESRRLSFQSKIRDGAMTMSTRNIRSMALLAMSLALCVLLCGMAQIALASEVHPVESANADANSYLYGRYGETAKSLLTTDANGNLQRVEYVSGTGLVVESYTTGGKIISSKVIDASTYAPSDLADGASVLWGGAFSGGTYNFVVTGQFNKDESDSLPVLRVTRYTKDWQYSANIEYKGINTYEPFDAGSCAFAENNGQLVVRTCHTMYQTSDKLHHQASMTFVIDEASMTTKDSFTGIMNLSSTELGYVSHSFDQKLAVLNGTFYSLDLGDAYPRAAVIKKLGSTGDSSYVSAREISGDTGENDTYTAIGGLQASTSAGTLLAVGTQRDQNSVYETDNTVTDYPRNVWLSVVNPSSMTVTKQVSLTSFAKDSTTDAEIPYIVKVSDDRFMVVWEEEGSSDESVHYVFVDGNGSIVTAEQSFAGQLSDCQPIVTGGKIMWYVTGAGSSTAAPLFYTIDAATGSLLPTGNSTKLSDASIVLSGDTTYTGSTLTPSVTVRFGGVVLTEGTDYTVSYSDNVNAGTAHITLTGAGTYAGQSVTRDFTIKPKNVANCAILFWAGSRAAYTGKPVRGVAIVKNGDEVLVEGTDYSIAYSNNVNAGTAKYTITALSSNYTGSTSGSFTIGKRTLTSSNISLGNCTYTGSAVEPQVKLFGNALGSDNYTITCT